ncbi:DMT family transporter [Spirochaeta lutea]|uniref:EamA domain-containing protein n=1 Tax=Spirochaeta lutea TaxID=1480694 RepID=A0A098QV32_9SPIO|nr:DMT family transporter [Spirochaeta lutea]KGE71715.1 hypothetical protein DC28_10730 [Spirochaeta lutea]
MLFIVMFLAMFFWGGSWVSAKLLSVTADPVLLTFWRFALISVAALPLIRLDRRLGSWAIRAGGGAETTPPVNPGKGLEHRAAKSPETNKTTQSNRHTWCWTVLAAVLLTLYNLVFFGGLQYGASGKAGVIVTTINPLFAFLLASLFEAHKPKVLQWLGLALGIAGGALQTLPDLLGGDRGLTVYTLLFLGAGLLWAGLTLCSHRAQRGSGVFTYTARVYSLSSGILLVLLLATRGFTWLGDPVMFQPNFWLNELYLALPAGVFATGMYFFAAHALGSGRGSSFTFLVPLSALLLSWILLGEQPGIFTLLGGSLSAAAVYIIQKQGAGPGK